MRDIQKCSCLNRGPRQSESYTDYAIQNNGVRFVVRRNLCKTCNAETTDVSVLPYPNNPTQAQLTNLAAKSSSALATQAANNPWS
jgi:hypothetical protein